MTAAADVSRMGLIKSTFGTVRSSLNIMQKDYARPEVDEKAKNAVLGAWTALINRTPDPNGARKYFSHIARDAIEKRLEDTALAAINDVDYWQCRTPENLEQSLTHYEILAKKAFEKSLPEVCKRLLSFMYQAAARNGRLTDREFTYKFNSLKLRYESKFDEPLSI